MILTNILLSIIALYCIVMGFYLLLMHFSFSFKISKRTYVESQEVPKEETSPPENVDSLMGKSTWELRPKAPKSDSARQVNQGEVNDTTFANAKPSETTAEQEHQQSQHNQFEADFETETAKGDDVEDDVSEEQELSEAGFDPNMQASGFVLSELSKAAETVWSPRSSMGDKIAAGELFYKLKGSDIAKQIESADSTLGRKIDEVIAFHLNKLQQEDAGDESAAESSEVGEFDIEKYV